MRFTRSTRAEEKPIMGYTGIQQKRQGERKGNRWQKIYHHRNRLVPRVSTPPPDTFLCSPGTIYVLSVFHNRVCSCTYTLRHSVLTLYLLWTDIGQILCVFRWECTLDQLSHWNRCKKLLTLLLEVQATRPVPALKPREKTQRAYLRSYHFFPAPFKTGPVCVCIPWTPYSCLYLVISWSYHERDDCLVIIVTVLT